MLDFGESVRRFYGGYTNPQGRSQRSAYWWVVLYQSIIISVLLILLMMADGGMALLQSGVNEFGNVGNITLDLETAWEELGASGKFAIFSLVMFALVNALPDIMLRIRRFHDLGQTGWLVLVFMLIGAVPLIGTMASFANLFWFMMRGTVGANKYGSDPLQSDPSVFG